MSLFFSGHHIYINGRRIQNNPDFWEFKDGVAIFHFDIEDNDHITVDTFINGNLAITKDTRWKNLRETGKFRVA